MKKQTRPEKLQLASLFTDHMVLQQKIPVPVWGWCSPQTSVTVKVGTQLVSTKSDDAGRWQVKLKALRAGGPLTLTVETADEKQVFTDVLVGEVYLCSGQSNMNWTVHQSANPEKEIEAGNWPQIRHFKVLERFSMEEEAKTEGNWVVCSPRTVGHFTAVGYSFARELHQRLGVPVGLIHASWGGTRVETWISRPLLKTFPPSRQLLKEFNAFLPESEKRVANWQRELAEWESKVFHRDPGNLGFKQGFADDDVHPTDWRKIELPLCWPGLGLNFNGAVWFRKEVDVPKKWVGRPLTLGLGRVEQFDTTYFNGEIVGGLGEGTQRPNTISRAYQIPGRLVKAGKNVIAVRVFSRHGQGGLPGHRAQMQLALTESPDAPPMYLAGPWKYRIEHTLPWPSTETLQKRPLDAIHPNMPGVLFDGMIAPLIPYALGGALWYQGESNTHNPDEYRTLFPLMIQCWRERWQLGNFPFFFVQLANHLAGGEPEPSPWAEVRQAQQEALKVPRTGMAVIIDIGDSQDVHPANKQEVGRRLALQALQKVYGKKLVASGPMFRSAKLEKGGRVRLRFDHAETGLKLQWGRQPIGFFIAGKNGSFVRAEAKIEKSTVVAWHPEIARPTAIRYAWGNSPVCNVATQSGLPMAPFRIKVR
jgi:sialate O-acetylesterase